MPHASLGNGVSMIHCNSEPCRWKSGTTCQHTDRNWLVSWSCAQQKYCMCINAKSPNHGTAHGLAGWPGQMMETCRCSGVAIQSQGHTVASSWKNNELGLSTLVQGAEHLHFISSESSQETIGWDGDRVFRPLPQLVQHSVPKSLRESHGQSFWYND